MVQTDGNVVGKDTRSGHVFLSTGTANSGVGPYTLTMENNCDLVLYDSASDQKWSSNSGGTGTGCRFVLQSNRYVMIVNSNGAQVWV